MAGKGTDLSRRHEWIVVVPFKLTDGKAAAAHGGASLSLDIGMVHPDYYDRGGKASIIPFCYACEQSWADVHTKPCPGQPPGRLEYVQ